MPFKPSADRRHHIPKQKFKVTNWRDYDGSLRQRGSLTVWFTEAAIAARTAETADDSGRWAMLATDERRTTELEIAVHALNRMLELGRPTSVRFA